MDWNYATETNIGPEGPTLAISATRMQCPICTVPVSKETVVAE